MIVTKVSVLVSIMILLQDGRYHLLWAVKASLQLSARQVDVPAVQDYRWRALHSITVLGDCLYIAGGDISQFVDGVADTVPTRPLNSTLSLRLDQSWTNSTVAFKQIALTAPHATQYALWQDPEANKIYAWGKAWTHNRIDEAGGNGLSLLAFTPDSDCGGSWAPSPPSNPSVFSTIYHGIGGTAIACGNFGFSLGGVGNPDTDPRLTDFETLPGLLVYDMRSGVWTNRSATFPYGTTNNGQAACLPFGKHGLVMFLGGQVEFTSAGTDRAWTIGFNNLTFYDPVTDEWFWQLASGDVPQPRESYCAVGVAGLNETYEIFVYGGREYMTSDNISDGVWVLTLPGFHWFRVDVKGTPRRWVQECAVVGKRQMIVVGGAEAYGEQTWIGAADPSAQGLAILDLSSLAWSSHYGPNAPAYDSPDVVKRWYYEGGLESVNWGTNNKVKEMFLNGSTSSTSQPTPSSGPGGTTTEKNLAPLIGGILGGVFGLLAMGIVGAVWHRRKKQHRNRGQDTSSQHYGWLSQKPELDSHQQPEPRTTVVAHELPPPELCPQELPVPPSSQELPGNEGYSQGGTRIS